MGKQALVLFLSLLAILVVFGAAPSRAQPPVSKARGATPAAAPGDLAEKVEAVARRLGVRVPPGLGPASRVRFLHDRLLELADDRKPASSGWLPGNLVRYLAVALEGAPSEVWRRGVRSPSATDRSAAADLALLLDAIDTKLDHFEAKQSAFPQATTTPANDDCTQAIAVGNESVAASTLGATNDGTASCGASAASPDVWFQYVAPASGLGVDHSPEMVRLAREQNREAVAQGRLEVREARADRLPFPDETFTCAAMSGVLGFLPDPVAAFAEIRRVLRPGGRFMTLGSDPELRGTPAAPEPMASRLRFYESDELEAFARAAGFEEVEVSRRTLDHYAREAGIPEEHIALFGDAGSRFLFARRR